jgi:hypothetical protein
MMQRDRTAGTLHAAACLVQFENLHANVAACIAQTRRAGAEFIATDLRTALALLEHAVVTGEAAAARRSIRAARRALTVIDRLRMKLELEPAESEIVQELRAELLKRLARLARQRHR